ncbi:SDR family NAD(P)-dependent oxidoreductase [Microbispora sp. RL4-1S]|uniref:SDR family NAD(P)-dependent oxidoreductase n=1 Tax=Microbispora oryzae TaxID=2806554 RepID=A0A940WNP0_9ACTN|nr:SDR family NAD(P)-dependent oxidoreductase [Microbispora oryzae]MBP2708248.1 SDR family NAD(P)-dependent oxidoreductase [Microbispora oryzae]
MDLQLNGKRALVTGSSSGLGEATVRALAAEGVAVVVHGRDERRSHAVAASIRANGGKADVAIGDLTGDEGADAVVSAALAGGPVDILVNNAGSYKHLSWADATPETWRDTYEGNVVSGVRMIQRLVPLMRERGWGRVITIGGGLAVQPMYQHPQYNATLAARHNLEVSLARELRGTGVTSNVVAPGAILVDAVRDLLTEIAPAHGWGETWAQIERDATRELVPNDVERLGRPEEIASAVAFLASPLSGYISGAVLRVDGGHIRNVA